MGFDKVKALSTAEKFLAQGKIPSAIQEYRKIVEHDASDFSALNTLGDLYVRTNKAQEAIGYFLRVADHYREQGFALKAIAMYKKISRFSAEEPGVALNLARLYEQQGLYVEARAQYLLIANFASRDGRARDALEALRRIADLDPKNVSTRLRLAEGYTREGMKHEAADAYVEAGELLLASGSAHDALDAYRHAHALRPESHAVLHGLVAASTAVGAAAEAAIVLEESIVAAPGDLELRAMLARTYIEATNAPAAERATDALVSAEHTNYPVWFEVAQLYLTQNAVDDAVRVLARAIEPALTGKQERAVLNLLGDALARDPDQIEGLKLVLRIHTWQRDDEGMRVTLERLADAARRASQVEEERRALEHLVRLVPFDQGYHERLSQLGGDPASASSADADTEHASDAMHARDAQSQPAQTFESPSSGNFSFEPSSSASSAFESSAFDQLAEVHAELTPDVAASPMSATDELAASVSEFEWNTVAQVEESAPRIAPSDPSASFADLNVERADETASAPASLDLAHVGEGFGAQPGDAQAADPFAPQIDPHAHTDPFAQPRDAQSPAQDSTARAQSLLMQELESVDFYIEQGYADIARDTLDMLERQYGASAETSARRERLQGDATPAHAATFDLPVEHESETLPAGAVEFNIDERALVVESVADARAEESARAASHSNVEAKPARESQNGNGSRAARGVDPNIASFFGEFLDAPREEQTQSSRDDDFETHYNLGVAYKEMALWDEAVEQFQKAIDLTAPDDGTPHHLECCNMLGHCLAQKGMPRAAVMWFKRALALPHITEDESQALRYDLASAYEQSGDIERAIDTFSEVYGVDVSYRGVAGRLRELQQRAVTSDK
jgi:tetratricopeptide (TPR) repeat protein